MLHLGPQPHLHIFPLALKELIIPRVVQAGNPEAILDSFPSSQQTHQSKPCLLCSHGVQAPCPSHQHLLLDPRPQPLVHLKSSFSPRPAWPSVVHSPYLSLRVGFPFVSTSV